MSRDFEFGGAIPPWGRSAAEYEAFFDLKDLPSSARVLDCGSGPASFAAEWSGQGRFVVAADPVYQRLGNEIEADFEPTADRMREGMRKAFDRFIWKDYKDPEDVITRRRASLKRFLADFQTGVRAGRYVAARLPELPFASGTFDLALCAHLLFIYSDELSLEQHIAFLRELLRVGREVRVFPLLDMQGQRSKYIDPVMNELQSLARVDLVRVPFEFRPGDCFMLRLRKDLVHVPEIANR